MTTIHRKLCVAESKIAQKVVTHILNVKMTVVVIGTVQ